MSNDWDLSAILNSMAIFVSIHTDIAVGAIAGAQAAADAMVFDNYFFGAFAENRVDGTAH